MSMIDDIEDNLIDMVIVKDMSRLGRDYLKVAECLELFRVKRIRFISVNEQVDTSLAEDNFTPFRLIMKERYARDTLRKIRSVIKAKVEEGKHIGSSISYGYKLDTKDKHHWIIVEPAVKVVQ